jgi:hypothetical protein
LRYHRGRYFDALQAADTAFQEKGKVDVRDLETMLGDMLVQQLSNLPGLPDEEEQRLLEIFDRRVGRVPNGVRLSRFGAEDVIQRLWAINGLSCTPDRAALRCPEGGGHACLLWKTISPALSRGEWRCRYPG